MTDKLKRLNLIDKIPFFAAFTDNDKSFLADLAYFQKYEPGDLIIEQNSISLQLFFTINGKVDIMIDGDTVTSFKGGGQIFGEMSFVHNNPASATVKASTKAVMMLFDVDKINTLNEPIYYRLRMDIYKACAEVLAKKLISTNEIARSYIHQEKNTDLILGDD